MLLCQLAHIEQKSLQRFRKKLKLNATCKTLVICRANILGTTKDEV